LLLPLAVGLSTSLGARSARQRTPGRDGDPPPRNAWRLGGVLLAFLLVDMLWRVALRAAVPHVRTIPDVDLAALLGAVIVAAAWQIGGVAAMRLDQAANGLGPDLVRTIIPPLAAGAVLYLFASGLVQYGGTTTAWHTPVLGAAAWAYAVLALHETQRVHRSALLTSWKREHRGVDRAVQANWTAWVFLLLGGATLLTAAWWLPQAEPLRSAAEKPYLLEWLLGRWSHPPPSAGSVLGRVPEEPQGLPPPGGSMPYLLLALLGLVILLGVAFRSQRGRMRRGSGQSALVRRLLNWWAALRTMLAGMLGPRRHERREGQDGRQRQRRATRPRSRPSTPREQVRYDYQRMLERARPQHPRGHAQSPMEYADALREALPEHVQAVDTLTRRFVEARYSHHPINRQAADETLRATRVLRSALRTARSARGNR
jgi:hypothetical protein